jgi:hypothetical protein
MKETGMTNRNLRGALAAAFLLAATAPMLAACDDKGPAEKVGERLDEGARDTKRAVEDATD